ncbi:M60 family metallopeptidase [uncultured Chryseobacterium sp.]|uniref:M60 family metallopeptidase n=1 Tax=uncultured Chryseobacterium sp. TaxID=259322 RepID=UPI0025FD74A5|nr:M60 family metallopeptidase [uncultured Chryseobacterium sp.]
MKKNYLIFLFYVLGQLMSAQYKMPVIYVTSLQQAQDGEESAMCNDGNINTLYHSRYNLNAAIPDRLSFYFSSRVKSVSQLIYKPRTSGYNGIWTSIKVSYSTQSSPGTFTDATGIMSFPADNAAKTINLASAIAHPAVIRIDVFSAYGNFSSCAEMEFYSAEQMDPVQSECSLQTGEFSGYSDLPVLPLAAGSSASSFQPGENIEKSFDGNINTLYHSDWNSTSATFPITLIYQFDGTTTVDYLKYTPRQDGGENGHFGHVKISYTTVSNPGYVTLTTQNFGLNGDIKTVVFPSPIVPLTLKIEVLDGKNNFASCAEMEFFRFPPNGFNPSSYSNIFNDAVFSTLKPGITQQDISAIASPFIKGLAQCLFDNTYHKKYRVQTFSPYRTVESVSTSYKIGAYNRYENPTGIAFKANTQVVVFARDISAAHTVYLKVRDFATEGSSPEKSYQLQNGINIISVTHAGLGYISYFTDDANAPDITVNITGGIVNGWFKKGTPSAEWMETLSNDVYPKVDIEGYYTKLVIDKSAVSSFHYTDAQPLIDKYDMIAKSQREMMGFFKFSKNVKNRQLVYTESTGGWFAGGLGVHLDLTWGTAASASGSGLGLWGVAHELGHVNQIRPGLRWTGTTEITNNLYSLWAYYNLYTPAGNNRLTRLEDEAGDKTAFPQIEGNRYGEFIIQTKINGKSYADQFRTDFVNPQDPQFRTLVPFWQLELYYQLAGASKNAAALAFDSDMSDENATVPTVPAAGIDYAHWFANVADKVIQTDESQLTQGQLVMNFVKNTCDAVQEDLTDFFTDTGFLRPINSMITDYYNGQLTITQSMIDGVKNYVVSKGYAKPVSPVINYISANSVNTYKNKLPVSGTTGIGAQVITNSEGRFLQTDNSKWNNAVAFETYTASNQLISVSIVGTGDPTLAKTFVDFPVSAEKVFAVGYNGQKILVYPATVLAVTDPVPEAIHFSVYPNPVKNGEKINLVLKSSDTISASLHDATGKLLFSEENSADSVSNMFSSCMQHLKSGIYILSVKENSHHHQVKIIKE